MLWSEEIIDTNVVATENTKDIPETISEEAPSAPVEKKEKTEKKSRGLIHFIKKRLSPAAQRVFVEKRIMGNSSWFFIVLFTFLAGFLTSLTPCGYPMIPITAGILHAQGTRSRRYNFFLTSAFVLGTATAYGLLGVLVIASSHFIFGSWLASPIFIVLMTLFFAYFAGAMFGWYEIYIPHFLRANNMIAHHGSIIYSFLTGLIAGAVASPCTGPVLGAVLLVAAQNESAPFAFIMLFSFALGLGVLLFFVGMWASMLRTLPPTGPWLEEVKVFLGFALLGVGIYFLTQNVAIMEQIGTWLHLKPEAASFVIKSTLWFLLFLAGALYCIISGWNARYGELDPRPLTENFFANLAAKKPPFSKPAILGRVKTIDIHYSGKAIAKIVLGVIGIGALIYFGMQKYHTIINLVR